MPRLRLRPEELDADPGNARQSPSVGAGNVPNGGGKGRVGWEGRVQRQLPSASTRSSIARSARGPHKEALRRERESPRVPVSRRLFLHPLFSFVPSLVLSASGRLSFRPSFTTPSLRAALTLLPNASTRTPHAAHRTPHTDCAYTDPRTHRHSHTHNIYTPAHRHTRIALDPRRHVAQGRTRDVGAGPRRLRRPRL